MRRLDAWGTRLGWLVVLLACVWFAGRSLV
jgi:hypothetical protein